MGNYNKLIRTAVLTASFFNPQGLLASDKTEVDFERPATARPAVEGNTGSLKRKRSEDDEASTSPIKKREFEEGVIRAAKPLLTLFPENYNNIGEAVAQIELRDRESVVTGVMRMNNKNGPLSSPIKSYSLIATIKTVAQIESRDRESVIGETVQMFNCQYVDEGNQCQLIKAIGQIEKKERGEVIAVASKVFSDEDTLGGRADAITAVAQLKKDERQTVIDLARQIDSRSPAFFLAEIIKAVGEVKKDEREGVVKEARKIIPDDVEYSYAYSIIKAISRMRPDLREHVVNAVNMVASPDDLGKGRAELLEKFAQATEEYDAS